MRLDSCVLIKSLTVGRVTGFKYIVNIASYPMDTGGAFPGVNRPGREADHSPPPSAEVKKTRIYTSTPPYAFMA
jgi:hypothetical protein